tara:strand:- start:232 stop:423 length:192 start_codon:yes stop_codon:yes gene_type:complete
MDEKYYSNLRYMIYIKQLGKKKPSVCIEVLGMENMDEAQEVATNLDGMLGDGILTDTGERIIH